MELEQIAKEIRKNILLQVYSANSGHPGGALSCADILTSIYFLPPLVSFICFAYLVNNLLLNTISYAASPDPSIPKNLLFDAINASTAVNSNPNEFPL